MALESESKLDSPATFSDDLPPESFWVAKEDWFVGNAMMQRKMSLKLGHNRNFSSFSNRPSEVISSNRPSFFGLPKKKALKTGFDSSNKDNLLEKKPGRFLFRSRSEPAGKAVLEPDSPRVSCTGRVGLKRGGGGKKPGFSRFFSSIFRTGPSR